jgi:putative membrane protein
MLHYQRCARVLSVAAGALLVCAGAWAYSDQDRAFVSTEMHINTAEIRLAQLVLRQSTSDDVKKLAERELMDHRNLENQILPLAVKMGESEPTMLAVDDQALLTRMQGMPGPEFNLTYGRSMLQGHRKALQRFKEEEADGEDAAVKDTALRGEPIIARHMEMAQHLLSTMEK